MQRFLPIVCLSYAVWLRVWHYRRDMETTICSIESSY